MAAFLTQTGRAVVTSYLNAGAPSQPKFIGWGVGTPTATVHDIGLFKEAAETRPSSGITTTIVSTTSANDTYQLVGSITSSSGQTITEVGIFDSASKPASTTWSVAPTGTSNGGGTTQTGTLTSNTGFASGNYIQDQSGEVMLLGTDNGSGGITVITRGGGALPAGAGSTIVASANGNEVTLGQLAGGTAVPGGVLFMHASFSGLPLNSSDSITFTLQVQFS